MIRKIVEINEEACNGCGLCAAACHEGAIAMVDGKAKLLRDDYCDGLGDCLPACPAGAIRIVEREAAAYDEAAVKARQAKAQPQPCACPGTAARRLTPCDLPAGDGAPSRLTNWPVQLRLASVDAPVFDGADVLVAADCAAYAYGAFHERFLRGRVALIGCPKLDPADYAEKLTEILRRHDVRSITVARMEVPCCGGIERAARAAAAACGKSVPVKVVTLSTDGRIL